MSVSGTLVGAVDEARRGHVHGWAQDVAAPGRRIELALSVAATLWGAATPLTRVLANGYRWDRDPSRTLYEGRVGFSVDFKPDAMPGHSFFLDVREMGGAAMPGSPFLIPAPGFVRSAGAYRLIAVDGAPFACLPADMLWWPGLVGGANRIVLPAGVCMVVFAVPRRDAPGDARTLGVPVWRIALDGADVDLASPGLARGFHPPERSEVGKVWRWSADVAVLDAGMAASPRLLEIDAGAPAARAPHAPPGRRLTAQFMQGADRTVPYVGTHWLAVPKP